MFGDDDNPILLDIVPDKIVPPNSSHLDSWINSTQSIRVLWYISLLPFSNYLDWAILVDWLKITFLQSFKQNCYIPSWTVLVLKLSETDYHHFFLPSLSACLSLIGYLHSWVFMLLTLIISKIIMLFSCNLHYDSKIFLNFLSWCPFVCAQFIWHGCYCLFFYIYWY